MFRKQITFHKNIAVISVAVMAVFFIWISNTTSVKATPYNDIIKQKAISYSYPLVGDGTISHFEAAVNRKAEDVNGDPHYTNKSFYNESIVYENWGYRQIAPCPDGVCKVADQGKAQDQLPEYYNGKAEAFNKAKQAGNTFLPKLTPETYANCSGFTGAVIINTVDPMFPGNNSTGDQWDYVSQSNQWELVGRSTDFNPSSY